jgi:undecaprenyl diphosphate synthase
MLANELTAGAGNVDLLIRTGGEKRLSDFLLWESAYAELLFTDRMWPDFDATDLDAALREFRHRERRFGGLAVESGHHTALSAGGVR